MHNLEKGGSMQLTKKELLTITGGAIDWTVAAIIGSAVTFITGIIDGFLRPIKCNLWN